MGFGLFGLIIVIILIIVVIAVLWGIGAYNRMVRARNLVEQSWNQIDVELNRRYDLIPNLVNTIKGATNYEKSTLESVVGLRNQAASLAGSHADLAQRSGVEDRLSAEIRNLITMTVEAYPDLKSNASFIQLQNELSEIESRIANARKYYNANVGAYNTAIESFPNSMLAGIGHFIKADYFQIQDPSVRQAPVVDFTGYAPTPGSPQIPAQGYAPAQPTPGYTPAPTPGYTPAPPAALPQQMNAPFAQPPAPGPAGDYQQPNFTQSSGVQDQR